MHIPHNYGCMHTHTRHIQVNKLTRTHNAYMHACLHTSAYFNIQREWENKDFTSDTSIHSNIYKFKPVTITF